ncbi:MAG: NACHT domain-containing protein [bacterium]|nr:NACHT domain-containing protein [bacterium]
MENVYVKLRAKESSPLERIHTIKDFRLLEEEEKEKSKKKDEGFVTLFERFHKKNQKERMPLKMLILGKPGSGKTTLMKWIALQCLKEKSGFFSRFVPVFLSLKDLGGDPDGTFRKKNIGTLTAELLEKENISMTSFFEGQFKANRLLFLLDGLDEIGDEKTRRDVIQWIQKQYIAQNSVIITSRFSGINPKEGLTFRDEIPVFTVQDFQEEDVHAFLQNWYRAIDLAVGGERGTQKTVEEAEKKSDDLIASIKKFKNLAELAVNLQAFYQHRQCGNLFRGDHREFIGKKVLETIFFLGRLY